MKVKFNPRPTPFDEVAPEFVEVQGKLFTLLGVSYGQALCLNEEDNHKWFLPCDYIETYYGEDK